MKTYNVVSADPQSFGRIYWTFVAENLEEAKELAKRNISGDIIVEEAKKQIKVSRKKK